MNPVDVALIPERLRRAVLAGTLVFGMLACTAAKNETDAATVYVINKPEKKADTARLFEYGIPDSFLETIYPYQFFGVRGGVTDDIPAEIPIQFYEGERRQKKVNGVLVQAFFPTDAKTLEVLNTAIDDLTKTMAEGWFCELNVLCIGTLVSIEARYSPDVEKPEWLAQNVSVATEWNRKLLTYSKKSGRLTLSDLVSKSDLRLALNENDAETAYASQDFAFRIFDSMDGIDLSLLVSRDSFSQYISLYSQYRGLLSGESTQEMQPLCKKINFTI